MKAIFLFLCRLAFLIFPGSLFIVIMGFLRMCNEIIDGLVWVWTGLP